MTKTIASLALVVLILTFVFGCTTPSPHADFSVTPTHGYSPLDVQFSDESSGNITYWEWDFNGDGEPDSTLQNPKYTYKSPGNYTVILRVSGSAGNNTMTKAYCIRVAPCPSYADFVAEPTVGVGSTTVHFTDKSNGNVTSWAWDFNNDGVIDSTQQNPSYTYYRNGNYTVILSTITTECSDKATKWNYISITGCHT